MAGILQRPPPRALVLGLAVLVAGLGLWIVSRVVSHGEQQAYAGATAPQFVQLTQDRSYWLATPGGVRTEARLGLAPAGVRCAATIDGARSTLSVTAERSDSKMVDVIGRFVAIQGGRASISCTGLDNVYVSDADDAPFDLAGLLVWLAAAVLATGVALTLSGVRATRPRRPDGDPRLADAQPEESV